ncbi:MAG: membrane protein [Isosphaeraceae bacterium]|nr:MAG: membrane protein [Isosphaeraceae bacterium]
MTDSIDSIQWDQNETQSPGSGATARYPLLAAIRRRIISGLIFALPVAITIWVVYWLISTIQAVVLDPVAWLVRSLVRPEQIEAMPDWWRRFVSPLAAGILVLVFLYFLGYFGRTRLYRALEWVILRVPIVTVIYKAVRSVFASLDQRRPSEKFKRVVLIPFPNREAMAPAFVTRAVEETGSGRRVLIVYVPYAPLPTQGILVAVPEDQVVDLDWDVNQMMQVVISFGLSAPATMRAGAGWAGAAPVGSKS